AGVFWAYYNGFVSPTDVELATSVEILLMVALGGRGTLLGPALGAGMIVLLKNLVSVYTQRWLLILGAIYVLTIIYAPEGIVGAVKTLKQGSMVLPLGDKCRDPKWPPPVWRGDLREEYGDGQQERGGHHQRPGAARGCRARCSVGAEGASEDRGHYAD